MIRLIPCLLLVAACSHAPVRPAPDAALDATSDADSGPPPVDASPDAADVSTDTDAGSPDAGFGVMSLNLHCLEIDGTGYDDNAARFDAIAAESNRADVRVLLLQEVCDDGSVDALAALETALEAASGHDWHGAFAFAHVAWEGTAREANEGVGILADVPLDDARTTTHLAEGSLRRVALTANLTGDLPALRVGTFHLDHADDAARVIQAKELSTAPLLDAGSADVVLGGDLNAREGSPAHDALLTAGYVDASATLRASRIDHVFVHRGAAVRQIGAELLFERDPVSDHPGVLVRLDATPVSPVELTTFDVDADVGPGNALFVRGSQGPLSWTVGWPALNDGPRRWRFATTELSGDFEYKVLRNDADWSVGENFAGTAGSENRATVSAFE